jgi:hypothetical protein
MLNIEVPPVTAQSLSSLKAFLTQNRLTGVALKRNAVAFTYTQPYMLESPL